MHDLKDMIEYNAHIRRTCRNFGFIQSKIIIFPAYIIMEIKDASKLYVEYSYINVDPLEKDEKDKIEDEVKKCNPRLNYPKIINNVKSIVGYKEDEIKEVLKI